MHGGSTSLAIHSIHDYCAFDLKHSSIVYWMFDQQYAKPQDFPVSAAAREKSLHQPFIQYLISVSREYLDTGTKREDTTGKDTTSMLKNAILLFVFMLLLCAVCHTHRLFSVEEQGIGVT